jgi:uncharacterized protein (UPF0335 family)
MKKLQTIAQRLLTNRQSRIPVLFLTVLLGFSALILSADSASRATERTLSAKAAQSALTGRWIAQVDARQPGVINMMFSRRDERGGSNTTTDNISRNELQGLPSDISSTAKTNVNFRIVREAGTFDCEGYFSAGKGVGFWTLIPSQSFISAMRSRGYDNLTEEDLLRAALHNLTTKFIEELKSVGYDHLEFAELLRASSHDVTASFIREMRAAGYQGLFMEELVRARNHDINSQYVKEVQAMGFEKQPLESLIRLRNHEIKQEFINQMRSAGFDNLSIEELIRLKNHEITPEFVSALKAEGYAAISPEVAIRLKTHNVDGEFIRRAKAKGFTNVSLEQLIRLRNQDIVK